MRNKGRLGKLSALFLALVLILTLASCGSRAEYEGTFRVGMECGYSPFNWTQMDDSNGAVRIQGTENQYANGYDVQIAKLVADSLKKELQIVKVSWSGLIPALNSGQIDAIIAGMSATTERKETIDFSEHYYSSDLVTVVKKDSPYVNATTLADFAGSKLTGQLGTLHYDVIEQVPNVKKHTAMDDFPNMIVALNAGTIDGYISERPGALSAVLANPQLAFVDFPEGQGFIFDDAEVSIGIGLRKDEPLLGNINLALENITLEQRESLMSQAVENQPSETGEGNVALTFGQAVKRIITKYWGHFLRGAATTLLIALIGTIIGLIIGLLVATFRLLPVSKGPWYKKIPHQILAFFLNVYVEIFRGTPMMVQATVFYYGISYLFGIDMSPLMAGLVIVSVNTGAYMTEVVRGGIESVDKGQFEASKAIGMTHSQTMWNTILPQAIRNILPATGNEFVINIKDSSVLNVIQVTELYFATRDVQANTLRMFETYLITGVIYLVLTFTITRILRHIEHRMDGPKSYTLTSSSTPATVKLHQKQGGN